MRRDATVTWLSAMLCGAWLVSTANAQPAPPVGFHADSGLTVYGNDDKLLVISPWAGVSQQIVDALTVKVGWKADAISSASVDVVSAATRGFEELRNEASLSTIMNWRTVRADVGYTGSFESDTWAHWMAAGGELDLFKRNLTLRVAYGLGIDQLGTVDEARAQWRDRTTHRVDVSVTQVLSRSTVLMGTYTLHQQLGFLASAYRRVPLVSADAGADPIYAAHWVAERHPDERGRHALLLMLKQAIGKHVHLTLRYRGYLDTWSMRANEAQLDASFDVGEGVVLELGNRFYWQSRASFYRDSYSVNRDFITRDRRLAGQLSSFTRLGVWYQRAPIEVVLRGELQWTAYENFLAVREGRFVPYSETLGYVIQLGVGVDL